MMKKLLHQIAKVIFPKIMMIIKAVWIILLLNRIRHLISTEWCWNGLFRWDWNGLFSWRISFFREQKWWWLPAKILIKFWWIWLTGWILFWWRKDVLWSENHLKKQPKIRHKVNFHDESKHYSSQVFIDNIESDSSDNENKQLDKLPANFHKLVSILQIVLLKKPMTIQMGSIKNEKLI